MVPRTLDPLYQTSDAIPATAAPWGRGGRWVIRGRGCGSGNVALGSGSVAVLVPHPAGGRRGDAGRGGNA
jgi:hypothetical protein